MLNTCLVKYTDEENRILAEDFLTSSQTSRPLPEDYAMRGLMWVQEYFSSNCFKNEEIDDPETLLVLDKTKSKYPPGYLLRSRSINTYKRYRWQWEYSCYENKDLMNGSTFSGAWREKPGRRLIKASPVSGVKNTHWDLS
ncbi:hypothetical protein F5Y16DRAFT_196463 [Xylariaceae sp. FL0255]|nr:hypothetical protein F5Y16DRAFT_196463 [Xylariaceae sp. FL0255]